jgi:hypothetical protein
MSEMEKQHIDWTESMEPKFIGFVTFTQNDHYAIYFELKWNYFYTCVIAKTLKRIKHTTVLSANY